MSASHPNEEKRIARSKPASACGRMNALDGCDGRVLCQRRGNRFACLWTEFTVGKAAKRRRGRKEKGGRCKRPYNIIQCASHPDEEKRIAITKTASACGGMNALDGCDGRVLCQRRRNRFASLWTDFVVNKAAKRRRKGKGGRCKRPCNN